MTNDVPPRRAFPVRARWLSVTGVVVAASLLVWHAQVADFLGLDSTADKQPVVAGSGAPGGATPPGADGDTPTAPPTRKASPRPSPKPSRTPSPRKSPKPAAGEESVEGLSTTLRTRLLKAMAAARADGVTLTITSGRRSAAKQRRLLEEAIVEHGSYKAATRWVLPPEDSAHVTGRAVDIGPRAGMAWLDRNGYRYGICRRYDNEPWHFEALTRPGRKCPPREAHSVASR